MIPDKLKWGDEIRIISPSRSLSNLPKSTRELGLKNLEKLGFKVTFSKYAEECNDLGSSSIKSRIEDLHDAFKDKNIKAIMCTTGGFNSNQLLTYLDFDLIKNNPKIFIGFSDITALSNAIYAKTGLVCYNGPMFVDFGTQNELDYTMEYFKKCVLSEEEFYITPSNEWSDDFVKSQKNLGLWIFKKGIAEGTIIGGNLSTINLLQSTEFMPSLKNSILFIEDDYESKPQHFDRMLQSLIQNPEFKFVKGIVIGRFESRTKMTKNLLKQIIKIKKIPVIANVDFGHTYPTITFPIGGKAVINGDKIKIVLH